MKTALIALTVLLAGGIYLYASTSNAGDTVSQTVTNRLPDNMPHATFAAGCFWCVESEFRRLNGVVFTRTGYTGGKGDNPTYQQISAGNTGHAEAIEVYYDPKIISYRELADHLLRRAHDPTQLNRQGPDVGTQYRSAIFYATPDEKAVAEAAIKAATDEKVWKTPIVTTLEPQGTFWAAEDYHQQYYEKFEESKGMPHINMVIKQRKWAGQKE